VPQRYSIDTSSFIRAWDEAYPPPRFSLLWEAIDELIAEQRLLASIEVFYELKRKHEGLYGWAKERRSELFHDVDTDHQRKLRALMARYPRLVDTRTGKSGADPFVIALAQVPPGCVVITEERGGSDKSPKIPFVCASERIGCKNLLELIEAEDWRF
jgi:hypothetical protein